jgi:transcriptional regulator with XRE-family HTH domain
MNGTLTDPRHEELRRLLKQRRQAKELKQSELAAKMGRYRNFVTNVETGQHRVSVIDFLDFAKALEFDPAAAIRRLARSSIRRTTSTP